MFSECLARSAAQNLFPQMVKWCVCMCLCCPKELNWCKRRQADSSCTCFSVFTSLYIFMKHILLNVSLRIHRNHIHSPLFVTFPSSLSVFVPTILSYTPLLLSPHSFSRLFVSVFSLSPPLCSSLYSYLCILCCCTSFLLSMLCLLSLLVSPLLP